MTATSRSGSSAARCCHTSATDGDGLGSREGHGGGAGVGDGARRPRRLVPAGAEVSEATITVDRERLVDTASRMVGVWSFTGSEEPMAELMRELYGEMGLRCPWAQGAERRAHAPGG